MTSTPKRPRDTNQLAKMVVDIATGEETGAPKSKAEAQRKGGIAGGAARALSLSELRRKEIAKTASQARWKKDRTDA